MSQNLLQWANGVEKKAAVLNVIKNGIKWGSRKSFPKVKGCEVPKVTNSGQVKSYGGHQSKISTLLSTPDINASVEKLNNIRVDTNLKNDLTGMVNGSNERLPEKAVGYFDNVWNGVKQEVGNWRPDASNLQWRDPQIVLDLMPPSTKRQIQFHGYRDIDELPNYIFRQIERTKDDPYYFDYDFKNLQGEDYNRIANRIQTAFEYSPQLAGALYHRALRKGADTKELTKQLINGDIASKRPAIDITQPIYTVPEYSMIDRLKQFGDQAMLTSFSIPGRTVRFVKDGDDIAGALGHAVADVVTNRISKNEKYYGDESVLSALKDTIVKDPNSPIKEFGPAPATFFDERNAYIDIAEPSVMHLGSLSALSPATIAHEYGHTKLRNWWAELVRALGVGAKTPIKALLLSTPEEIRASMEGFLLLRRQGLPIKESLRAFSGVPTYMLPGIMQLLYRTGIIGGAAGAGYGVYKAIAPENK